MATADVIEIEYFTDYEYCEQCGGGFGDGVLITKNGEIIHRQEAEAHCFDGSEVDYSAMLVGILKSYGIKAEVTKEEWN